MNINRWHLVAILAAVSVRLLRKCVISLLEATLGNKAAALAVFAAAAAALFSQKQWAARKRRLRAARLSGHAKIELLPMERDFVFRVAATSTVTFFSGSSAAAEEYLTERVAEIVAANPWLASVLEYDPETDEMAAYYPTDSSSRSLFHVRKHVQLPRNFEGDTCVASYQTLSRILEPQLCPNSCDAVGTGAPLFSVILLPDASGDFFAVVVSANHSLMDGHGFYSIYNMLSKKSDLQKLNPARKQQMPAKMLAAMGGETFPVTSYPDGMTIRFIYGVLRSKLFPEAQVVGFDIDPEWLSEQKAKWAKCVGTNGGSGVPFVSTNDCAVSSFLNCLRPDIAMMAINFRGKLDDCEETDAGNYEGLLTYMPDDYSSPALLRKSVMGAPYRRAAQPPTELPSNWERATGAKYAVCTNWSTFARPLVLPGDTVQKLHLPLYNFEKICPANMGLFVIFQPAAGRVGALVACKKDLIAAVKASGMVGTPLIN